MGCDDQSTRREHVPYCKPHCKEFKLVTRLENVRAQCVRCSLLHEFTVTIDGKIKIKLRETEG